MNKATALEALTRAGLSPRALSRIQAAAYVNVSPGMFDGLVARAVMPRPRRMGERLAWDRLELDTFFSRLPHDDGTPGATPDSEAWDVAV